MQQIPAKYLASGDAVFFPRIGKRTVLRYAFRMQTHIALRFDDKLRTLPAGRLFSVELAPSVPDAKAEELYRFDLETGRISVILETTLVNRCFDVRTSFRRQHETFFATIITDSAEDEALLAVQCGATLFTDEAVYTKDLERLNGLQASYTRLA